MDRKAIAREFPIGVVCNHEGRLYDPITAAVVITAAAGVHGAVSARKQRKEAAASAASAEAKAEEEVAEQEALALEEKKASDTKLEEQRARILKGQTGKGGLLFGSELGVTDDTTKKTTLGA